MAKQGNLTIELTGKRVQVPREAKTMTEKTETKESKDSGTEEVQRCVIKPCPFCGSEPTEIKSLNTCWLRCDNPDCLMTVNTYSYLTKEQAIEVWNKRAL